MSNLTITVTINSVATTVVAKPYAFPKAPKVNKDYTLTLNGKPAELAQTGGGKYPTYVYFKHEGKSMYLPANCTPDSGSELKIVVAPKPEVKTEPVKAEVKPEAEVKVEPVKPEPKATRVRGHKTQVAA